MPSRTRTIPFNCKYKEKDTKKGTHKVSVVTARHGRKRQRCTFSFTMRKNFQIRSFFKEISQSIPNFCAFTNNIKLGIILGEGETANITARYVYDCQSLRDIPQPFIP